MYIYGMQKMSTIKIDLSAQFGKNRVLYVRNVNNIFFNYFVKAFQSGGTAIPCLEPPFG